MTITANTVAAIAASRPVDLPPPEERQAIRRGVRLTQVRVGAIVGVTSQMVGLWENGRSEPTGVRRIRYAELLDACIEATQ